MKIEGHAVLPAPGDEDIRAYAVVEGVDEGTAERKLLEERQGAILAEKADPLRYGWENPMWRVCDALFGWELDKGWDVWARARFGLSWEELALRVRLALGFRARVKRMLIMGANRSGKSEYPAKRGVQLMLLEPRGKVLWAHEMSTRSNEEQQPLVYKYLPPEIKMRQRATAGEYVKFKQKTGFSEGSFILENESMGVFRNYTQEMEKALEGLELNAALADERTPTDWVDSLKYRTATRDGIVLVGFTPVNGYSPTVKAFCDSMAVTMQGIGFCLPDDGGPADLARELGFTERELAVMEQCLAEKVAPPYPASRPEEPIAEILAGRLDGGAMPGGRSFERVPRVARGFEPDTAIVWFHGRDNPYGNPVRVLRDAIGSRKGKDEVRCRVYGIATKAQGSTFAKFRRPIHVLRDSEVPVEGTNYMLVDPHPDRNNFMLWIRSAKIGKNFTYREWPGSYDVPGIGVPEPWAKPSGRRNGVNDGDKGEGQNGFGFGLLRIKFEVARLERWVAWQRWSVDTGGKVSVPDSDEILEWDEAQGAVERISRRLMDPRAAQTGSVRDGHAVTLIEEFEEIGVHFETAPGTGIQGGLDLLVNALDYNEMTAIGFNNSPRHFCAESCLNSIFAFENYQNAEGDKGAMKDPIDCHRWFYTAGLGFDGDAAPARRPNLTAGRWERSGGGGSGSGSGRNGLSESQHVRIRGRFSR